MDQTNASARRQVRIAAIAAYLGSGLFLLPGSLLAVALLLTGPQPGPMRRLMGLSMAIILGVGLTGVMVATGLLRLRSWARDAALAWSFGTTLLFVIILATPQSLFGVRPNPAGLLLFLMYLVPLDIWWFGLFIREEVVALFGAPATPSRRIQLPDWLKENWLGKSILAAGALAIAVFVITQITYRTSPLREIERCRDALKQAHSWHFHTIRPGRAQSVETIDVDTVCPVFERRASRFRDQMGEDLVRESIHYFNRHYNLVGDHWVQAVVPSGYADTEIQQCVDGPLHGDENILPFETVLDQGRVKRGETRTLNGDSCRVYEITAPVPNDYAQRIFHFSMCINEADHLPRETHSIPLSATQEINNEYSQWNARSEPEIPAEISE